MQKRRTWWIPVGAVLLGLGILVVLVLRPRTVPIPAQTGPVFQEEWTLPAPLEELPPAAQDSAVEVEEPVKAEVTAETHPQKEILPVGYVQVGRLVYELKGKWVAEETYRLARRPEGMEITSAGSFSVKVLFVPVTVNFNQEIFLDSHGRPRSYKLEARGPLGFGNRRVSVSVNGNEARVATGSEARTLAMPSGNAFFVGTLAAYAILPALYAAWAEENGLVLFPVGTGGGPGAPSGAAAGEVRVIAQEPVPMETTKGMLLLDRYRIRAGNFAGTLLAWGPEFVAFLGEGERTFTAYRADLFPKGIRLFH